MGSPYSNPYQTLDDRARAATDETSVQLLTEEIWYSTLFGRLPVSLASRMNRAQLAHLAGKPSSVSETSIATAINYLGKALGGKLYTGTNALQVRLLRVAMYPDLSHLLNSPTTPPTQALVGPDLSPSGGAYISFLLLRQKLTNPAWFGDPNEQNAQWTDWKPPKGISFKHELRIAAEPPSTTAIRQKMERGLQKENGSITGAFRKFFNLAGFPD